MKMNPVVHFEMPAEDNERASKFYSQVFGWHMTTMGQEYGDYLLANTTDTDPKTGMIKTPGAINGGFFRKGEYGNIPHVIISVDDLSKHMEVVKKAGGEIEGEPSDIPGVGKFVMFKDTEGNKVGMLQPIMN
jgi:predicted enzyme related to lactoylglutathione lyase